MSKSTPQAGQTNRHAIAEIRGIMAAQGKTHAGLYRALGLSQSSIHRRLTGAIPLTTDEIDTIAAWLQVPVSRLITKTPASYAT